jgi:CheY-like chemotaxis protein
MRLLLADDDADMRQSMRLLLERAGHEVELAADGADALDRQRERACDVLITDIFMGEADGLEAIENFRHEFPAVRIIAMSGGSRRFPGDSYLATASLAGADAVLLKPFGIGQLLETLRNLPGFDARGLRGAATGR